MVSTVVAVSKSSPLLFTTALVLHSSLICKWYFSLLYLLSIQESSPLAFLFFFFTQCTHFKRSLLVLLSLAAKAKNLALAVREFFTVLPQNCATVSDSNNNEAHLLKWVIGGITHLPPLAMMHKCTLTREWREKQLKEGKEQKWQMINAKLIGVNWWQKSKKYKFVALLSTHYWFWYH